MFVMFLVSNVVLGALLVLILRTFTGRFLSIYVLGNMLLVILSAVQAFVFLTIAGDAAKSNRLPRGRGSITGFY
jgi:hypothetical protein